MYRGRKFESTVSLSALDANPAGHNSERSLSFVLSSKGYEFAGSTIGFQQWRILPNGLVEYEDTVGGSFSSRHSSAPKVARGVLHIDSVYFVLVTDMYSRLSTIVTIS